MRAAQFTAVLLSLSPLVSAWPQWLPELDALVMRRQDDSTTSTTSAAKATQTADPTTTAKTTSTSTDSTASTTKKATITTTNLNTGGITQTDASATGSGTGGSDVSSTTAKATYNISDTDPVGSVVLLTPATASSSALYKIGDYITFAWNYTNVIATPTGVNVLVSCSTASETWTLTQNMTYETRGSFTWDSGATAATSPLLTEEYKLMIYDADSSPTDTGDAGYLGSYSGLTFGLYTGRPYTPLASGWTCATCSAALSDNDRRAFGFALWMAVVTILSFTWFVTGF